jgi:fructokinase
MRILSIGEIIWDVFEPNTALQPPLIADAGPREHLGGAPLNFAAHARRLGHETFILSAVGDDERGPRAIQQIAELRVAVDFVQRVRGIPTGFAAVEFDTEGHPHFAVARPVAYDRIELTDETLTRIADMQPDWIYFGTLFHTTPSNLAATKRILEACPTAYRVYDMNLRGDHWTPDLVRELSAMASVVKASEEDMQMYRPAIAMSREEVESSLSTMTPDKIWGLPNTRAVVITRGEKGAFAYTRGDLAAVPAFPVTVADTVGAGDAFTAAFIHALSEQRPIAEATRFANAVGALVASRIGANPEWSLSEVDAMLRSQNAE